MTLVADARADWGTGESLCAYGHGLLDEDDYEESRRHTDVVLAWIADPVLRDAMEKFAEVIAPMTYGHHECLPTITPTTGRSWYADINLLARRPMTIWIERHLVPEVEQPATPLPQPVEAIAYIQDALGLSLRQVLKAAGVRPRTYHSWHENPGQHGPRLTSLGPSVEASSANRGPARDFGRSRHPATAGARRQGLAGCAVARAVRRACGRGLHGLEWWRPCLAAELRRCPR